MGDTQKPSLDALRIDRSQPRSSRRWPWIVILALLIGGAWLVFQRQTAPIRVTTVAVVERSGSAPNGGPAAGSSSVLDASGYVTARRQATVSSKTTGKVVEVLIEEGMEVKEGDVLARLDSSNMETSLALARAQLAAAQSALAETRVRLEQARRNFKRVDELVREKVASAADFDVAEAEAKSLEARLLQQTSEVEVAEKQIAFYQQQMEDLVIRAPFDGVVVSKDAQPGEMISPVSAGGGFTRTGICTLVDMDSREIEVDVSETYINRVNPDQPATAKLDAYPNWKIPARVITIVPTADRQKATVKVRIAFEQLDPRILPDMGVKVAFLETAPAPGSTETRERKWIVPAAAIRSDGGRDFVWILDGQRLVKRPVTVGGREGDDVWITSGLAAGEAVVTGDASNFKENQPATNKTS